MTAAFPRSVPFGRILMLVNLFLFAAAILATYEVQISGANAYMGYADIQVEPGYLALLICSTLLVGAIIPLEINRPSDFFCVFYVIFVVLPYTTLFPISNSVGVSQYLLHYGVLLLPVILVRSVATHTVVLRLPSIISYGFLELVVVALCLAVTAYALRHAPSAAAIDLGTSYDRRIEGREIFQAGTPIAYLNAALVNGFAPFLAFLASWRRSAWLFLVAFACGSAFFYVLGLKAPIFYIVLAYSIGFAARSGRIRSFVLVVFCLLWLALLAAFVEFSVFDYSYVADYFLRRVFAVPAFLMSTYFEFMFHDPFSAWLPASGLRTQDGITFFIGESYLGLKGANANTDAFLYALAAGGVPLYLLTILLVTAVFVFLDATFRSNRNAAYLFVGFLYAILLVEQAATTALVSSGVGALIVLVSLTGRGRQRGWYEDAIRAPSGHVNG